MGGILIWFTTAIIALIVFLLSKIFDQVLIILILLAEPKLTYHFFL